MKLFSLITFIIHSYSGINILAQDLILTAIEQECLSSAKNYKSTVDVLFDINEFKSKCLLQTQEASEASPQTALSINKNEFEIHAQKNYIFIDNKSNNQLSIIAGSKTKIHHILKYTTSSKKNELAILNHKENGSLNILIFSVTRTGNISPLRIIDLNYKLKAINNFTFLPHNHILMSQDNFNEIYNIDVTHDSRNPLIQDNPQVHNIQIDELNDSTIKDLKVLDHRLLILTNKAIEIFSSRNFSHLQTTELLEDELNNTNSISINPIESTFSIHIINGGEVKFQID